MWQQGEKKPAVVSYRAHIKWQDEDDEEAEVPGQQRPQQHHTLLLPQISITLEEEEGQEENNHNHDNQSGPVHGDSEQADVRRSWWWADDGIMIKGQRERGKRLLHKLQMIGDELLLASRKDKRVHDIKVVRREESVKWKRKIFRIGEKVE